MSCVALPTAMPAQEQAWDRLAEGLEVSVWTPGDQCGHEVPSLFLVRVDPERYRFSTYHFSDEGLQAPIPIQDWRQRTGASIVFNAGLFREDYSYLGLLLKDGRSLGSRRHPQWQGLFVAEPVKPGLRKARVLDLSVDGFATENPVYREAAQSLMLLDRTGHTRVRHTGKRAHQMVVAEDDVGRILLIRTADAVALWDLADCLRTGIAALQLAMAMDGGSSAELVIGADLAGGQAGAPGVRPWQPLVEGSGVSHSLLPAVIGVLPRAGIAGTQERRSAAGGR